MKGSCSREEGGHEKGRPPSAMEMGIRAQGRVPDASLRVGITVAVAGVSLPRALIIERLPAQETGDQDNCV